MSGHQDLLSVTAFFSALFHAVIILGISFKLPEIADIQNTDNTLDVVLINAPNNKKPDDADVISSSNTMGGGNDDREASSPVPYEAVKAAPVESIKRVAQQQPNSTIAPDQLVTKRSSQVSIQRKNPDKTRLKASNETIGPDLITTKSQRQLERERLLAKVSQEWADYQKRPNKKYLSPSTKQHEAAEYLDKWRKRVEVIGNANYPAKARAQSLSGTLILTVEINRSGTINSIIINNPSKHKLLNDAALRFVRNASPFDAVPDDILPDVDILVITRAFLFNSTNRLSTTDASSQKLR